MGLSVGALVGIKGVGGRVGGLTTGDLVGLKGVGGRVGMTMGALVGLDVTPIRTTAKSPPELINVIGLPWTMVEPPTLSFATKNERPYAFGAAFFV